MSVPLPPSSKILVIGSDPALRDLCHDGLPWAGCATEFATDIAEAMTNGVIADVMVIDLPATSHTRAALMHLREYALVVRSTVIALTDDPAILARAPGSPDCQVLARSCPPEALWDAVATAVNGRYAAAAANHWRRE